MMPRKRALVRDIGPEDPGTEAVRLQPQPETVVIPAVNFLTATFVVEGTAPLVVSRFSEKARETLMAQHQAGDMEKRKRRPTRPPRDFDAEFDLSLYKLPDGGYGIPAAAFRHALIRACSLVGFKMTLAKLALFIEAQAYEARDGTPCVRIIHGHPEPFTTYVRNNSASGSVVDLRCRARFAPGWRALVPLRWDGDQFRVSDVVNLLERAGQQVGILEGRPSSSNSAGMGWGLFRVVETAEEGTP